MLEPRPATLCVHGASPGEGPDLVLPVHPGATFRLEPALDLAPQGRKPRRVLLYSRYGNPTVWAVERQLARLEGAEDALLAASGMAALGSALLALTRPGERILAALGGYGTTTAFLRGPAREAGRRVTFLPDLEPATVARALEEGPVAWILAESLGNPLNQVADLPELAGLAHAAGARLAVDATFASPVLQRPLELGADLVLHSASKSLNGHSDLIAGVVAGPEDLVEAVWDHLRVAGACLDPAAAARLGRGLKTLHLRVERAVENAGRVAAFLQEHPRVRTVHWPGLPGHPHYERARRLLPQGPGAVVSFRLDGDDEAALRVAAACRLWTLATSLGGVESLVSLPSNTSHAGLSPEERATVGIHPGTLRLAVGIEDAGDLLEDLEQALQVP